MKALLLCQNLNVGGAEELLRATSARLPAEGVDTAVVAITRRGPLAQEIARAGTPVYLATGQPGPRDPAAFVRLVRLLRYERPDVVHTFLLNACLYGRLAAIFARVPLILAAEQNVYTAKKRRHAHFERLLATGTFRVVACCQVVADAYHRQTGVASEKIAVVYNAVAFDPLPSAEERASARALLGLRPDALVVGTLGRLTEQKAHRTLLEAVARLALRLPHVALVIAGDGPLRGELEAQAVRLGLGDRVRFLGVRRDRATLYGAMDVFALPSLWEGLSLSLIEAMGAGRPLVATAVGGNPEVIEDLRTGLLVPSGDPRALAEALESLLRDPQLSRTLGAAACEAARTRFGIDRHVAEIADLYRQGLGRPDRSTFEPSGAHR